MCPAQVYEVGDVDGKDADGNDTVEVKLAPSNCVQCGAMRRPPNAGGWGDHAKPAAQAAG